MNLDFTSEQDMLRDSAAKFLANECPYTKVKEIEESDAGYAPELWAQMAELGWLGMIFPEEYGGYAGEFIDLAIIQEEIGKMVFPSPFLSTVVQCGFAILEGGTEDQKTDLLGQIAEGSLIMAMAQYEEEASYLEMGINMPAKADGDNYVLNGTKMFVMDANIAGKMIVAARTDEGVTLFLVDGGADGLAVNKMPTIGMDNTCEVIFNNVTVPAADIIGSKGGGWAILENMNAKMAVAKAAEMVGGCHTCISMTTAYAKEREQYGKPIGGYQIIQHYVANMLLNYDTASNFLYRVVCLIDEGDDFSTAASVMKASINESYKFIAERAVQIHGGIGTTREHDIGLFYRRAKSFEYVAGDTDFHYEKVIESLLENGPELP